MRLFIAINFNENIKDSLFDCILRLKKSAVKGNFTRKENLHLTLVFIGETNKAEVVKKVMDGVSSASFPLTLSDMGKFKGNRGDIYWIGVNRNPVLTNIHHQLRQELVKLGFIIDHRAFKPHLTLGREVIMPPDFSALSEREFAQSIPDMTLMVDFLSLMKSERINGRLTYTEIYRQILG